MAWSLPFPSASSYECNVRLLRWYFLQPLSILLSLFHRSRTEHLHRRSIHRRPWGNFSPNRLPCWSFSKSHVLLGQGNGIPSRRNRPRGARTKVSRRIRWEGRKGFKSSTLSLSLFPCSEKFVIHEKKISSYKTRMILTINNLSRHDDAGSYVCVSGKSLWVG